MTQPADLKVFSEHWPVRNMLELFVYQDGELIGTVELDLKDTMFAESGDALHQLIRLTRNEPFEEFNKLINGE